MLATNIAEKFVCFFNFKARAFVKKYNFMKIFFKNPLTNKNFVVKLIVDKGKSISVFCRHLAEQIDFFQNNI